MRTPQYCAIIPPSGTSISLRQGMLLKSGGRRLVLRKYDRGDIVLQDLENQDCRALSEGALLDAIFVGKVEVITSDQQPQAGLGSSLTRMQERGATEKAISHAAALLQWITALRQRGIREINDKPWVHAEIRALRKGDLAHLPAFARTTIYEADLKLRHADGDAGVLVPEYANRGGRGKWRIDAIAQEILKEELEFRLGEKPVRALSIIDFCQRVGNRIATHNDGADKAIDQISESTVRRFIKREVPAYVRLEMRSGTKKAQKQYRVNSGARDRATRPLEVAEYDDIDSGVFLVDERNGLPFGRSFLTNGVDQCVLTVLGYDLGTKPRSYESAIGAICDSLLPKTDCLPGEMGHGAQGIMLVDNASYNAGKAMKHRQQTDRLLFARARPFGSTEKSVIEHYNHHVKADFCTSLPGWRGDKNDREAIKRGETSAIMTLQEFAKMYRHWVTKVYANTPGEDGFSPKQRWLKFYQRHSPAIRYTPQHLEVLRLRPTNKPLTFRASGGLEPFGLRYDSGELQELRKRLGAGGSVYAFTPTVLTYVMVLNPFTNGLLRVPSTEDPRYVETTTLDQHLAIRALQRTRKIKNPSIPQLLQGREIMRQMVAEAIKSHKLRTRRWAVTVGELDESAESKSEPTVREIQAVCTELEYQLSQLEVATAEAGEDWE